MNTYDVAMSVKKSNTGRLKRKDIITIGLQEDRLVFLEAENKQLWKACLQKDAQIKRLRIELNLLKKRNCGDLDNVCV